jgi:hypothetical protein
VIEPPETSTIHIFRENTMSHLALDLSRSLAAAVVTAAALAGCAGPACRARCTAAAGACSAKKCAACAAKKCGACAVKK